MNRAVAHGLILMLLMIAASVAANALRPTLRLADTLPPIDLERMIPRQFGEWKEVTGQDVYIVNPQQQGILEKIYDQTLARIYVNSDGYRIMLSIAYGGDQSDSMELHRPEVCYPAQGFQMRSKVHGVLESGANTIPVTRLETILGRRYESVTYWIVIGDRAVAGGLNKKIAEIRFNFMGYIPDGLLVRVSSIDPNTGRAQDIQSNFIVAMLLALDQENRHRISGRRAL